MFNRIPQSTGQAGIELELLGSPKVHPEGEFLFETTARY
jgi:hypothetical protein